MVLSSTHPLSGPPTVSAADGASAPTSPGRSTPCPPLSHRTTRPPHVGGTVAPDHRCAPAGVRYFPTADGGDGQNPGRVPGLRPARGYAVTASLSHRRRPPGRAQTRGPFYAPCEPLRPCRLRGVTPPKDRTARSGSDAFVQTAPRHRQQGGRHRGANPSPAHAQPHLAGSAPWSALCAGRRSTAPCQCRTHVRVGLEGLQRFEWRRRRFCCAGLSLGGHCTMARGWKYWKCKLHLSHNWDR